MSDARATIDQLNDAVHQNRALSRTGLEERLFSWLFRGLVYAQIWEDPVVDMAALEIGPETDLVCIASGGCNMMSYLTAGPASVEAVDLSPAHVALGRLKIAAAQELDYDAFYQLFGRADLPSNRQLFDRLAPALDIDTRAWWTARRGLFGRRADMLTNGFYRYGVLGRFIGAAHLLAWIARVDFRPLLTCQSLDAQRGFFDAEIAPLFENRFVRWLARRPASLFGLGIPPQQFDKLAADAGGDIVAVLRERTRKLVCDFPIDQNYFAWAAFNRGYSSDGRGPVPPYLEEARFGALAEAASRARIVNRNLTDLLAEAPSGSKSAYVLLDAQDWMDDAQLNALWSEITRTARPGARVVFRTGGTPDILPGRVVPETLDRWTYHAEASAAFWEQDRSAIYGGFHLYSFDG